MRKHLSGSIDCRRPRSPACRPARNREEAKPGAGGAPAAPAAAPADDKGPIKVGILHSLSGTMAITETSLKDVALMAIDEINAKGGVLGKKLEPVVVDPASNWPLFAEKARAADHAGQGRRRCSAAGPRCRASRCCRCSRS